MEDTPLRASIALAAYSEPLVEGRRAVVFGDASSRLAEHLLERGARLVHVYDPDPTRVAEAATRNTSRNISFAPLAESGAPVRDGAFDLAIVENLAAAPSPAALLKRVRRALAVRGVALIASANPDMRAQLLPQVEKAAHGIDYYALYDAVTLEFEQVRMLGQTPFVGYTIVDFAANGEPAPAIDSGFVPGGAEEPEWFIALASQHPVELDAFEVVQLPFLSLLGAGRSRRLEEQLRDARSAERHARERMAELEAQTARLREAERMRPPARDTSGELERLKAELDKRDAWIAQLEARAATADARADDSQTELEQERARAEQAGRDLSEQKAAVERADEERDRARQELERREAQLAELTRADSGGMGAEIDQLEAQLAERGRELLERDRDLREAERIGRELLLELMDLRAGTGEQGPAEGPTEREAELVQKLDSLARLNAQREADLEAARWSIGELEGRLADVGLDTEQQAQLEDDLTRARAEVQKLATLVAQLRANAGPGEAEVR